MRADEDMRRSVRDVGGLFGLQSLVRPGRQRYPSALSFDARPDLRCLRYVILKQRQRCMRTTERRDRAHLTVIIVRRIFVVSGRSGRILFPAIRRKVLGGY